MSNVAPTDRPILHAFFMRRSKSRRESCPLRAFSGVEPYTLDGVVVFFQLFFSRSFIILVVGTKDVEFNGFF
jgi:hypothetical protein